MEFNFDFGQIYLNAKSVILNPRAFFKSKQFKSQKNVSQAFVYYAALNLWLVVGSYLVTLVSGRSGLVSIAVMSYFSALIILFAVVFLLNLLIRAFGAKADYKKTFRLFVYSGTPSYVFGFIPIANFVVALYGIYILVLGTMSVYSFTARRAMVMYFVGIVLTIILTSVIGIAFV